MIKSQQRLTYISLAGAGGILLLLLTGCGNDRSAAGPPPGGTGGGYAAPAPSSLTSPPATAAGDTAARGTAAPDPLLSGGGALSSNDAAPDSDPLLRGGDPLKGPVMPTDHTHWLRGRISDARLTVLLNGIRQGEYSGVVDQDITMKLRRGINSVTFLYTPRRLHASAQMNLLESEHDPPVPPLVTFQSKPLPESAADLPPTTQHFTFFAR